MLGEPKTSESFVETPKFFDMQEEKVILIGDAKRLSEQQVLGMLERFSGGDWGSVTEVVRKIDDEQLISEGPQDGTFLGQYKLEVGGEDIVYYVYGNVVSGKAETINIISKAEDNRLHGEDVMETLARYEVARERL